MPNSKITIHQGFYGEVNRSHACIDQTIIDPDLTSFLIAFTDRPAALPPGVSLVPYLSGSAISKYFVFAKTFPDSTATRAGMVFTHVLILDFVDIADVHNLRDILSLFVESIENKEDDLSTLQISPSNKEDNPGGLNRPKYIQQIASAMIAGVKPILFSGESDAFITAIEQIWNSPKPDSRSDLKFRTSFTPTDIENGNFTIVSIQKDFLSKWQGRSIIDGGNLDEVEITSYSEAMFFGSTTNNPLSDFVRKLGLDPADIQSFGQYEKIFENYTYIDDIIDASVIRRDIRTILKLSPSQDNGAEVKEAFVERLAKLIEEKRDSNVKALRNIDWSAFPGGEQKVDQVVSKFVKGEFENPSKADLDTLIELIDIIAEEKTRNWWHNSVSQSIEKAFKSQSEAALKNIWELIDTSQKTAKGLILIVDSTNDCEAILRKSIPESLGTETCSLLGQIAQKKLWYLLHADISLKQFTPGIALESQLKVEQPLSLTDSVGVRYLAQQLPPESLISLTLKLRDKKLISLAIEAIVKNKSLLVGMDPRSSCWLEIWTSVVRESKEVFDGLSGREQEIVFTLMDLMLEGEMLDDALISRIAGTPFSNISAYKNRSKVWELISQSVRSEFLSTTTHGILGDLLSGRIDAHSIESEISNEIISDPHMTRFLDENRDDIEPVIRIYEGFSSLRDNFLADYITYFRHSLSESQSDRLGDLVLENNFSKSARAIHDKARYNPSFSPAYEKCKEIVDINWLESMWGSVGSFFSPQVMPSSNVNDFPTMNTENAIIADLPTVVILTAINVEYSAVKSHLTNVVDANRNDTSYEAGVFEFNGKKIAKIFIRECGAKNSIASQETERAINHFKPDVILFVGIAGSRKPNDFGIGDVIFPDKIFSYEAGKAEKDSFLARPDAAFTSYTLVELAKKERRNDHWKSLIKGPAKPDIKADLGIIASGEGLVEHTDSRIGKILSKHYNDTSAVEMEGFGFGKAASRQGRESNNMLVGIVRGISDILEQPSKTKQSVAKDRRPANAKQIASDSAAAFAFWLILKLYE